MPKNGLRITVMDFCEAAARRIQFVYKDWKELQIVIDDWLSSECVDGSFSWAAGDGVVNAVRSGAYAVRLFSQMKRLVLPGSPVILRHMLRPLTTPKVTEIFAGLVAGRYQNFGTFRHQVAQSLQASFTTGIETRLVHRLIVQSRVLDRSRDHSFSWPAERVKKLDSWSVKGARLCYPTIDELREITKSDLEELKAGYGHYEMAEYCLTIVYRTRITDDCRATQ